MKDLPVACTLTPAELAARRRGLLPGLIARASAKEPVDGGFRWRFDSSESVVSEIAAVIDAERRCCLFLRFLLVVEAGGGPVWLSVTGPEGTRQFLSAWLEATPAPSGAT